MEIALNNYSRYYYILKIWKDYIGCLLNHEIVPLQVQFLTTPKVIVAA